ncbi:hypothetical protein NEHOM01_1978 [Nematocida homosporus]|uniref:uncharacterized protein n=1 Tax=Nematocida homosporus TaxID=1912981 RepID=UPI00221E796F|nr:uncharacterized protein NEHOM01_1978 [Nematocida homosporus]KAI5187169.1 hypothetical protein NEHOM01_1978 [Nematocida homosporus]
MTTTPSIDLDWGRKGPKKPLNRTQPYQLTFFSNPKKRKVDEKLILSHTDSSTTTRSSLKSTSNASFLSYFTLDRLIKANYVISSYLSLILNSFLVFLCMLLILKFIISVKNDISIKTIKQLEKNKLKIEECTRQYFLNKCDPSERVPALEDKCNEWAACMRADPFREEITKVVFQVASDAIEEFLTGVSIRSVLISTLVLSVLLKIFLSHTSHRVSHLNHPPPHNITTTLPTSK